MIGARQSRPFAVLLLLLVAPGLGDAQPEPPHEPDAAVAWIRPEEITDRADALQRRLAAARPSAATQAVVGQIEGGIAALGRDLDPLLERAGALLQRKVPLAEIEDVRRELASVAAPLVGWKDQLAAEAKRVADALDVLAQAQRLWSATLDRPETVAAGPVVAQRVTSSLRALDEAAANLRAWRERVLSASDHLLDRSNAVDAAQAQLEATTLAESASLFERDRAPFWQQGVWAELESELPAVPAELLAFNRSTRAYAARDARPFIAQLILALLLMFSLHGIAQRAPERLAGQSESAQAARVLERPFAIGLLLALLPSATIHPLAPQRLMQMVAVVTFLPAARIVIHASARASLFVLSGLFGLLLLDRLAIALAPLPALSRAIFLLALAIALGLAFSVGRRVRERGDTPWIRRALRLATLGLGLALVAELGGWTNLAALLGRGVLGSGVAGLFVYAAVLALEALLVYALASPTLRRSHLVDGNQSLLQRRAQRGIRWLGAALWLNFVLTGLSLRSTAADGLQALLQSGISVGALSLSVGGVLALVLTLVAALLLARIVNGVLEADVYPRTNLPRGTPYALSTLVRYGIYSLGFLLALAAAGVELSQLTILLGGFGIGIGLGLQDLVKNFAAGLTLLFERRVQVGDTVQIPSQSITGRVLAIGIRATVVRNSNGVEVVVPNADLVSGSVSNWTLSDPLHRIEVAVGVAYGTDPERVVALLLGVAVADQRMLAEPAPQALFKGFGESSLDFVLRAWTDADYEPRTSALALAVNRSLCEAGIDIPFPQRDLHLASVSPAARAALSGPNEKE